MKKQLEYFKSKGIHISISGLPKMVLQSISFNQDVSEEDFSLLKFFMAKCIVKEKDINISILDISDSFSEYMKLRLLYAYYYQRECNKIEAEYRKNHLQFKLKKEAAFRHNVLLERPVDFKADFKEICEIRNLQSFIKINLFNLKAKLKYIRKIEFNYYNKKYKLVKGTVYMDVLNFKRFNDIRF